MRTYTGFPHCPLLLQPVFEGPTWDAWQKLVSQSVVSDDITDVATTTASDDLLRVQPEIAGLISKLVNAVKTHGDVHQHKIDQVIGLVNNLANGQFEIAFPGLLKAQLVVPGSGGLQKPPIASEPGPEQSPESGGSREALERAPEPPMYDLFDARTVADAWREWSVGIAGRPALQGLEDTWGHLLRPTARQKTAWYRRKLILDELRWLQAHGRTEEAAVVELEALRAGRSLYKLGNSLIVRQKDRS